MKPYLIIILCAIFIPSTVVLTRDQVLQYDKYKAKYRWMNPRLYSRIVEESVRQREDYRLIFAIIDAESNGKRTAVSCAGAMGYLQVMPSNYSGDKNDLFNERINISTGIKIFKMWKRIAKGNLVLALNHYNRGYVPGASIKYIAKITHNYWGTI